MAFNYEEEMQLLKKKELTVVEAGKEQGVEEMPATHDTQFDAKQFDIKFECQKVARHLISDTKLSIANYADQLNSYEAALRNGVSLPDVSDMKATAEQELRAYLSKEEPIYIQTKTELWKSEKNKNSFLIKKGIDEMPTSAPDSKRAHYMTLAAYAIIETVINIFIFNEGLSGPDALLLSSFITVLNILPAVIVGNALRNIHSDESTKKILATSLAGFWFLFILWLNTSVSVLRSFLTEATSQLGSAATTNLFNNQRIGQIFFSDAFSVFALHAPPIKDVLSILLWLVGILAALLACWKGYTSDEKIPELGNLNRDVEGKKQLFIDVERSMRDKLSALTTQNTAIFDAVKLKLDANLRDYKSSAQLLTKKIVEFDRYMSNINDQYIHLINLYRDGNRVTRKSPAPDYFKDKEPVMTAGDLPDFSQYSDEKIKEDIAAMDEFYRERNSALNELKGDFNNFLTSLNEMFEAKLVEFDLSARKSMIKNI